jgi:DNA polymerase-3 subunit chi
VVLLFDGEDEDAAGEARQRSDAAKARGFAVIHWRADAQGRWQRGG